ncbi:hypothetical protein SynMITS9220_01853 [Synechococcus sp. MIT S9220]|nr:hypothetical protein SynMITS9220_01853 [Synechococcus sp. MIT S9220]
MTTFRLFHNLAFSKVSCYSRPMSFIFSGTKSIAPLLLL